MFGSSESGNQIYEVIPVMSIPTSVMEIIFISVIMFWHTDATGCKYGCIIFLDKFHYIMLSVAD